MPTPQRLGKTSTVFQTDRICAFCHTLFKPGDIVVFCPQDKKTHHEACWSDNGDRCAVHGCGFSEPIIPLYKSKVLDASQPALPVHRPSLGWLKSLSLVLALMALVGCGIIVYGLTQMIEDGQRPLTPRPPTYTPTSNPISSPTPGFSIRAYDSQRDAGAKCVVCSISDWEWPRKPGNYEWRVTFPSSEVALLSMGWCAIDKQALDANWLHMNYELAIDDYQIAVNQLTLADEESRDWVCRFYSGVLTGWSPGLHSFTWTHRVSQMVNDGWSTHEQGDYVMKFVVDVRTPTPLMPTATHTWAVPTRTPRPMPTRTPRPMPTRTPRPMPLSSSRSCPRPEACITYPAMRATLRGVVQFRGTATHPNFDYYKFEFKPQGAKEWSFLARFEQQVNDSVLMEWHTKTVPPGTYWLRLIVVDKTGNYWPEFAELRVTVADQGQ